MRSINEKLNLLKLKHDICQLSIDKELFRIIYRFTAHICFKCMRDI